MKINNFKRRTIAENLESKYPPSKHNRGHQDYTEEEYGWRAYLLNVTNGYDFLFKYVNKETGQALEYVFRPQALGEDEGIFIDTADVRDSKGNIWFWSTDECQDPDPERASELLAATDAWFSDRNHVLLRPIWDEYWRLFDEAQEDQDEDGDEPDINYPPTMRADGPKYHQSVPAANLDKSLGDVNKLVKTAQGNIAKGRDDVNKLVKTAQGNIAKGRDDVNKLVKTAQGDRIPDDAEHDDTDELPDIIDLLNRLRNRK